jgi:hypothetical protein
MCRRTKVAPVTVQPIGSTAIGALSEVGPCLLYFPRLIQLCFSVQRGAAEGVTLSIIERSREINKSKNELTKPSPLIYMTRQTRGIKKKWDRLKLVDIHFFQV